ncbi:MAG: dihydrofolate reductase family protein [Candidatus Promineifilaceae bacterium]|nr:dihydrofolate reductase family protein [Candidatus Promineifilaceae bacterium]
MSRDPLLRLFPQPVVPLPLAGLYLSHDLRGHTRTGARPFLYTNFISSLDGRIAVPPDNKERDFDVPDALANQRDWRLFQELAAQADVVIVSGAHLRQRTAGRAGAIIQFDDPQFSDLARWRRERSLPRSPDIAVVSNSLDFAVPEEMDPTQVHAFTSESAPKDGLLRLERQGVEVVTAGERAVDGQRLMAALGDLGFGVVYSPAGPHILNTLLQSQVVDRMYVTIAGRALGGPEYLTMVEGQRLQPPAELSLAKLYYDAGPNAGPEQLFAAYDRV